ncbi:MAG: hypothetical protein ACYDCL_21555 [Myxococcales bacterium]
MLTAFDPVHLTITVTLWKDVPFGLVFLALTVLLFRASLEPRRLERPGFWISLVLLGATELLLRHNGLTALLGAGAGALLLRPRRWLAPIAAVLAGTALALFVHQAIARRFHPAPAPIGLAFIGVLGSHLAHGTPLEPGERELLASFHPLEGSGWNYDCYSNVPTVFDGHFDYAALSKRGGELALLAAKLTWRRPLATLDHVVCASSLLWRIPRLDAPPSGPGLGHDASGHPLTVPDLPNAPLSAWRAPGLAVLLDRYASWTDDGRRVWLFWRPALPFYLCCLAALVAWARRRSVGAIAALLPLLFHTAGLALFITSQDVRYQ